LLLTDKIEGKVEVEVETEVEIKVEYILKRVLIKFVNGMNHSMSQVNNFC